MPGLPFRHFYRRCDLTTRSDADAVSVRMPGDVFGTISLLHRHRRVAMVSIAINRPADSSRHREQHEAEIAAASTNFDRYVARLPMRDARPCQSDFWPSIAKNRHVALRQPRPGRGFWHVATARFVCRHLNLCRGGLRGAAFVGMKAFWPDGIRGGMSHAQVETSLK